MLRLRLRCSKAGKRQSSLLLHLARSLEMIRSAELALLRKLSRWPLRKASTSVRLSKYILKQRIWVLSLLRAVLSLPLPRLKESSGKRTLPR